VDEVVPAPVEGALGVELRVVRGCLRRVHRRVAGGVVQVLLAEGVPDADEVEQAQRFGQLEPADVMVDL